MFDVLVLVLHFCAVTVSSTGPRKLFKEMTTTTSVVLARFPWLLPIWNPCELRGPCRHSYFGPRTCGGGENQCHRSWQGSQSGFPLLTLKCPLWCSAPSIIKVLNTVPAHTGRSVRPPFQYSVIQTLLCWSRSGPARTHSNCGPRLWKIVKRWRRKR